MERYTCSWVGKPNILVISILPKLIHKFNSITVEFPAGVCTELDKLIRKFTCERKCARISNTILKGKYFRKRGLGFALPYIKIFYTFLRMKSAC